MRARHCITISACKILSNFLLYEKYEFSRFCFAIFLLSKKKHFWQGELCYLSFFCSLFFLPKKIILLDNPPGSGYRPLKSINVLTGCTSINQSFTLKVVNRGLLLLVHIFHHFSLKLNYHDREEWRGWNAKSTRPFYPITVKIFFGRLIKLVGKITL